MADQSKINISFLIGCIAAACVFACFNLALTLYVLDARGSNEPQVVTVNAADMMLKAMSSVDPSITEEELASFVKSMNAELGGVVTRIAAENNLIVVNSASVLSGAPDITDVVLQAVVEVLQ